MKLHIFNPEHDISLAHNNKFYTAPRAGRRLREDCCFIPALWAGKDDFVLVDDVTKAKERYNRLSEYNHEFRVNHFVTLNELRKLPEGISVEPWGWDSALCFRLAKEGLSLAVLPGEDKLEIIREFSSRRFSSHIQKKLRHILLSDNIETIGESRWITDIEELKVILTTNGKSVLKEPWSSSGRGVRYVGSMIDEATVNWSTNIISRQGGIMVEPYYNKLMDFGMEFCSDSNGVRYKGLSLFKTVNGFYEGNVIASEDYKLNSLTKVIPINVLDSIRSCIEHLLYDELKGKYEGPLGVDMMIATNKQQASASALTSENWLAGALMLHPMVEINLRRTMGHVAIDLSRHYEGQATMHIDYSNGRYSFSVRKIN